MLANGVAAPPRKNSTRAIDWSSVADTESGAAYPAGNIPPEVGHANFTTGAPTLFSGVIWREKSFSEELPARSLAMTRTETVVAAVTAFARYVIAYGGLETVVAAPSTTTSTDL